MPAPLVEEVEIKLSDGTWMQLEYLREHLEDMYECEVLSIIESLQERETYDKAFGIIQKKYFRLYRDIHGHKAMEEQKEKVLGEVWGD